MNISTQYITNSIKSKELSFEEKALLLFRYQATTNNVYREWINLLNVEVKHIHRIADIPFLPISAFKHRKVKSDVWDEETYYLSSGTTLTNRSMHYIRDVHWYHQVAEQIWSQYYSDLNAYEFVALLPHYSDNPNSSLLSMVSHFMSKGLNKKDLYFHDKEQALYDHLENNHKKSIKTVLFGVSFALLEYAERFRHQNLSNSIVIETGGMKKFRKELTRLELHAILSESFRSAMISSEYGMTECTSQLYSTTNGKFPLNDYMQVFISDPSFPSKWSDPNQKGRVNIVDLGNIHSCSFIATDDLGMLDDNNTVEILGRIDNSELRGCNYLL